MLFLDSTRLGVVVLGDRLMVAAMRRASVETFEVQAENPSVALRAELDARGISARTVAVGLSRASVSVKPIELPAVDGDVRDVLKFELERHLPFPADDAPYDFVPVSPASGAEGSGDSGRVFLVTAADRHLVDSVTRLVQDAGLRPTSITVACHDLVDLVSAERRQRVVWLHRSGDAFDVMFLDGGRLALSRNVVAMDEAALTDEVRRSLAVARWRTCDAVWVSGDGGGTLDVPGGGLGWLGAQVSTPPYTTRAQRWLAAVGDGERRGAAELGIAVAGGRRVRVLDLIPAPLKPRRITRAQAITAGTAAAAVLLGLAALFVPGYREGRRLAALNREIARLDPEVRAVEKVARELERRQRLLALVDSLETNAIRPLPVLRELTEVVPNDAWLTTLSLDAKGIELTGQAAAASSLIPILENSPRFERVEFASPVTRGRDREQFRIRAAWEPGGASLAAVAAPGPPPAPPGLAVPGAPPLQPPRPVPGSPAGVAGPAAPGLGAEGGQRPRAMGRGDSAQPGAAEQDAPRRPVAPMPGERRQ